MVYELGTVGMVCPFPLIEAQKKMNELNHRFRLHPGYGSIT